MSEHVLEARLVEELGTAINRGLTSGELMTPAQVSQQTGLFLDRFGPSVLRGLDGEALLQLMHGRQNSDSRCLAYWLEFKDDDEFAGYRFGGIGGGSALKFGIYQRQADNARPFGQRVLRHVLAQAFATHADAKFRRQLRRAHHAHIHTTLRIISDALEG